MSGLGIFEAYTVWLTLSKQKSTATQSTCTCIFYSANEFWIREEFPNQEWFQFLHNISYKQITVKWLLSDHLRQELMPDEN